MNVLVLVVCLLVAGTSAQCPARHFHCVRTNQCIRIEYVCDGFDDCGTDELDCKVCSASHGFFCDKQCIRSVYVCDGVKDCADGSDERMRGLSCSSSTLNCEDGKTRRVETKCDGRADCDTGVDEYGCQSFSLCKDKAFFCDDGCWPHSLWCDGVQHCRNGLDERYCDRWGLPSNLSSPSEAIPDHHAAASSRMPAPVPKAGTESHAGYWVLCFFVVILLAVICGLSVSHPRVREMLQHLRTPRICTDWSKQLRPDTSSMSSTVTLQREQAGVGGRTEEKSLRDGGQASGVQFSSLCEVVQDG